MARSVTIHEDKILDRWSFLVEKGHGHGPNIFKDTVQFIKESAAHGVLIEEVAAKPEHGLIEGLSLRSRDYLMVTNQEIKDYRMWVGARDYGNALDISWYLTCQAGAFKKLFSAALSKGDTEALSRSLNLFEQQDLSAYATVVHHCLIKAIEKLLSESGQDSSQMDRKSKGFLGIS